jgi:transposase
MNIHKNARLTPHGRELLVRHIVSGQTTEAAARAAGVCPRTALKWVARFLAEGVEGLQDRSSRPHRLRKPTPLEVVEKVEARRRQRWTGKQIAAELNISGVRQPHSQAPRSQSHRGARAGRADPAL